jgi:hypothetical protein
MDMDGDTTEEEMDQLSQPQAGSSKVKTAVDDGVLVAPGDK